jgi:hypothetical protein
MYGETEGQTDRFQLAGRRHLNNVARQMGMDGQTGRGRRRCRGRYRRTSGIDRLTDRQTDNDTISLQADKWALDGFRSTWGVDHPRFGS